MDMDDRGDDAIRLVVSFPKKMNLCMKGYADKYLYLLKPGMEIHRIGISFSSKERKISEWKSLDR